MKDPQGCGLLVDCPANYSLEEVKESAARWDGSNASHTALQAERHSAARSACGRKRVARLRSGGWCLAALKPGGAGVRSVHLPGGHDYLLAEPHAQADAIILDVLLQLLKPQADGSRASVLDLGAGLGQYGHALLSADSRVAWHGYDGAGNVEEATGSFVRFVDLTLPLSLPRADWVLSLEVGEHVPSAHEAVLIRNLHALNCRGILLSWASLWQSGHGHVNNHGLPYLRRTFEGLGYRVREDLTHAMRRPALRPRTKGGGLTYFAKNPIALERVHPLPCATPTPAAARVRNKSPREKNWSS